jgi:hypothetical protein
MEFVHMLSLRWIRIVRGSAMRWYRWLGPIVCLLLVPTVAPVGAAADFASPAFRTTWQVGEDLAPNFWGPLANARAGQQEPYAEASGGQRLVQYFDKGRMELTNGTQTNGLLATELLKGQIQTGNATFQAKTPPSIPIAGDPTNTGPTYAQVGGSRALTSTAPSALHADVRQALTMSGASGPFVFPTNDPQATIGAYDAATSHNVAAAFAAFRDKVGLATVGYAIVEPFWTSIGIRGNPANVLVQAFERRVLTYTPSNAPPFKVEFGNIGQHYYQWRYGGAATPLPPPVVTDDPAQAAMQFLPLGASVTSARAVDLDGNGQTEALVVAEASTMGPGHSQIALLIVKQGNAWQLAYRTPPDQYATVTIDAIPKSATSPAFVIANWHLCGANCNTGGHTIIRWDGGGKTSVVLDGQDDRGNLTADAATGAVKLAGPVYRSQDPRCCPAYQYSRTWSWQATELRPDTFTIFNLTGSSAGPPPAWLTTLGPSLFLSFVPLTAGLPTPAGLAPIFGGQVEVRDLQGNTCTAQGASLAVAFAGFPSHAVYGLWPDGANYRAVVVTSSGGAGKTPAMQADSCTVGGDGVDGYTVTLVGATGGGWQITAIEAVPHAYQTAPDTAIAVPPV